MLSYVSHGNRNFQKHPVEIKTRNVWEFWALLRESITIVFNAPRSMEASGASVIWAFPPALAFGCRGHGECERAVFDFTIVPGELEQLVPSRGYYRANLSESDCARLRSLSGLAMQTIAKPTQITSLQQRAIAEELSLLALREVPLPRLPTHRLAQTKMEHTLAWYASNLPDNPSLQAAGKAVHVSPAHLRRLFHKACGESPKTAFNRVRMARVEKLLHNPNLTLEEIAEQVGLSGAPVLVRAVKQHFGVSPSQLRQIRSIPVA